MRMCVCVCVCVCVCFWKALHLLLFLSNKCVQMHRNTFNQDRHTLSLRFDEKYSRCSPNCYINDSRSAKNNQSLAVIYYL